MDSFFFFFLTHKVVLVKHFSPYWYLRAFDHKFILRWQLLLQLLQWLCSMAIHTNPDAVCSIKKYSGMAGVSRKYKIIIWDEYTVAHKHSLEAPKKKLKDHNNNARLFGGALLLLTVISNKHCKSFHVLNIRTTLTHAWKNYTYGEVSVNYFLS